VLDAAGTITHEATITNSRDAMAKLSKRHPGSRWW
jgi:hypothetical protein